jgi:hypothetical protein
MSIQFTRLGTILVATLMSNLLATHVMAQNEPKEAEITTNESITAAFDRGYFLNSRDAFDNQSIVGTLRSYFGITSFAEKQIALDGEIVHVLYEDILNQQTQSGDTISTQDLTNPFNTSLSENPDYSRSLDY